MRLLLIEDDRRIAEVIKNSFVAVGIGLDAVETGQEGLTALKSGGYDAIILDLNLPDSDGMSVLGRIREEGSPLPVLILTAREAIDSRVAALEGGADDYLIKPFAMSELIARMRALMRRPETIAGATIEVGNVTFHGDERVVRVGGEIAQLSRRETEMLHLFMRRKDTIVPKTVLESNVFGSSAVYQNTIDVAIHRLRRKLEDYGATVSIRTSRGAGYSLTEVADASDA